MAKLLPNVSQLVSEVLTRVDTEQTATKIAAKTVPVTFTVPVALGLQKLAQQLRKAAAAPVTFEDVDDFADRLKEYTHGNR